MRPSERPSRHLHPVTGPEPPRVPEDALEGLPRACSVPQVAEIVQCHPEHRYRMIRQAQAEGRKVPGLIELPAVTSRQRGRRFYRFVTAAFLGSLEAA